MGAVVYMSKRDGLWERWQINPNGRPAPSRTPGRAVAGEKKIRAPGLATCMSLNIISQTAAVTVHFPGYLCSRIPGYTGPAQPVPKGADYQAEYDQLTAKTLEMVTSHRGEFGRTQIHVVQGPNGHLARAEPWVRDIFGHANPAIAIDGNWQINTMHDAGNPRETVVDLDATPPTFRYGRTTVVIQ
jgi:hypothetical protein